MLEIRENIQISSYNAETGDGDSFFCTVDGKAFRDQEGNYIRETVSFQLTEGLSCTPLYAAGALYGVLSLQALLHNVYPCQPSSMICAPRQFACALMATVVWFIFILSHYSLLSLCVCSCCLIQSCSSLPFSLPSSSTLATVSRR